MSQTEKKGNPLVLVTIVGYMVFALYLFLVVKILLFKFGSLDTELLTAQWEMVRSDPGVLLERLHTRGNLVPFHEIQSYLHAIQQHGSGHSLVNFAGNIVAFMPFGFLLPLLFAKKASGMGKVVLLSLLLSLLLETTQLAMSCGAFDVDDLLLNTSGGFFGYVIYRLVRLAFFPRVQNRRNALAVHSPKN